MKKILTVLLVLTIVVGAVFAADTKKIEVKTSVDGNDPAFKLYASESDISATTATLTGLDASTLTSTKKISENTITVYFKVKQVAVGNYARCKYSFDIDVAVGALTQAAADVKTGEDPAKVAAHIISFAQADVAENTVYSGQGSNGTETKSENVKNKLEFDKNSGTYSDNATAKTSSANIKLKYNGLVLDQDIANFKVCWYRDETLPNGNYAADVTITYTIA